MVDCGSRRCAQERRSLRRDLQSLSKKLPVILGLESIADVFAKENKSSEEPEVEQTHQQCRDFQSSSHCFYCEKKLPNVYKRIHRIINDAQNGKENKGKLCLRSLQDLIPFCLDFYTHGFGRELFSDCVKTYFTTVPLPDVEEEPSTSLCIDSQPVSSTNSTHPLNVPSTTVGNVRLSKQQQPTQSLSFKPLSSSRCIDEKRLDCKRDAMSMMHHHMPEPIMDKGIKQEPESFLPENDVGSVPPEAASLYNMFLSQLPQMDVRQHSHQSMDYKDLQFPFALQNFLLNSQLMHPAYLSQDSTLLKELHLAQIRRVHNLDGVNKSQPRPAHGSQLKMPILINIVRKLVREKFAEIKKHHRKGCGLVFGENLDDDEMMSDPHRPPFMPFPSSLFSLGYKENEQHTDLCNGSNFSSIISEDRHQLKHFGKVNECSRIGSTLKEIIVKSIAEKVKLKEDSSDENSCPSSPSFSSNRQLNKSGLSHSYFNSIPSLSLKSLKNDSASTSRLDIEYSCSPPKRVKKEVTKSSKCSVSSSKKSSPDISSPPPNVKKTRPKRGQYRKYNSQLLMDAVRAVQSGEMSVHRAGSFFGVPHSTLEYKVKERHLLRQKKVKDSRASPVSSSSPKSDHQQSSLRLTIDLSRDSSPALSEVSMYTTPSSLKKSESLPSSSVINLDKKKLSPVSFTDQKVSEQLSPSPTPSALSSSPCASNSLNNNNNGKKDISLSTASWLQPYLCDGSSSASDVPAETGHQSLPSLLLDNSASELLRKLQHKVQTSTKVSFPPSSTESSNSISRMPSLASNDSAFVSLDSSSPAISGRFSVYNQSA